MSYVIHFKSSSHDIWQTVKDLIPQITRFVGPTWGPPGSCRPQMGPMLAPWTLLSGSFWACQAEAIATYLWLWCNWWNPCDTMTLCVKCWRKSHLALSCSHLTQLSWKKLHYRVWRLCMKVVPDNMGRPDIEGWWMCLWSSWLLHSLQGEGVSISGPSFPGMGIPMLKMRRLVRPSYL